MNIEEIKPRTFKVNFETREELLKTFIRFQEYYESPEFKDKVFTVDEYAKWYVKEYKKETFSYYSDWSGCNVPSYVFDIFRNGKMNPLSEREVSLLNQLPDDGKKYYVIGTFSGGRADVIQHELCHGLFYSNEEYKSKVLGLLSEYDNGEVESYISNLGYHNDVLLDEVHAYISASSDKLDEEGIKYSNELKRKLKDLVSQYE